MKVFTRRDDRIFVIYINQGVGRGMVEMTIWERVRPSWIIFKDKYIDSKWFWLSDYNYNITDGINAMLANVLDDEEYEYKLQKAWQDFNTSINKR